MITIFQGRKLSLNGASDVIYAEIAVSMRDKIHLFNDGRTLNAFGIFMCIALHADKNGWAYPGRELLSAETGISTEAAITRSIKFLRNMTIDKHSVLRMYRQRMSGNRWGRTVYRIFPDAFGDDLESAPLPNLVVWEPENEQEGSADGERELEESECVEPPPDNPLVGYPPVEHHGLIKKNHPKEEQGKEIRATPDESFTEHIYFKDQRVDPCGRVNSPPWSVSCSYCGSDIRITEKDVSFECKACGMKEVVLLSKRPMPKVKHIPEAVSAYYLIAGRKRGSLAPEWEKEIAKVVGSKASDLTFWRSVVKEYCGRGWNRGNVSKMLEYYKGRALPGEKKKAEKTTEECTAVIDGKEVKVTRVYPQPMGASR